MNPFLECLVCTLAVLALLSFAAVAEPPGKPQGNVCFAELKANVFTTGNGNFCRSWRLGRGTIRPTGRASALTANAGHNGRGWSVETSFGRDLPVEAVALRTVLKYANGKTNTAYRFRVYEGVAAVDLQRIAPADQDVPADAVIDAHKFDELQNPVCTVVELRDHTDRHGKETNLVHTTSYPLSSTPFKAKGNIAYVQGKSRKGVLFIKLAPLSHARAVRIEFDYAWDGKVFTWHGPGVHTPTGKGYRCATIEYSGGRAGRIAALQDYYRKLRRYKPARDGLLLSNTWGDRSRDSKINESFLMQEVSAASQLGVDVLEIDDGWQKGTSKNSSVSRSKEGVWSGFWKADPQFWTPHPSRLPNGLEPIRKAVEKADMQLGLWYAPDSENSFANWERDTKRILDLHREQNVDFFKLDSITMKAARSEMNVRRMLETIIRGSNGEIVVDLDVTAGVRPGYLGAVFAGPVFVENRYTDWHSYWPHRTLRNFWSLAAHVDPVRLRMEFLNNQRNENKYSGKLAPSAYPPDYLFASVMFGSPLAWMETSELQEDYMRNVANLVDVWKRHRQEIHTGHIIPVGNEPDGYSWTGFASIARNRRSAYLLVLRETTASKHWNTALPLLNNINGELEILAGRGKAAIANGRVEVEIPRKREFLLLRIDLQ